jgi:hypothetical protein
LLRCRCEFRSGSQGGYAIAESTRRGLSRLSRAVCTPKWTPAQNSPGVSLRCRPAARATGLPPANSVRAAGFLRPGLLPVAAGKQEDSPLVWKGSFPARMPLPPDAAKELAQANEPPVYSLHAQSAYRARHAASRVGSPSLTRGLPPSARRSIRLIVYGSSTALMMLTAPLFLLAGAQSHHSSRRSTLRPAHRSTTAHPLPLLHAAAIAAVSQIPSPGASSATPMNPSAPVGARPASIPTPTPSPSPSPSGDPAGAPASGDGPSGSLEWTVASWYGERPSACYDASGRFPVPTSSEQWVAAKYLPCGTMVEVTGPAGKADLRVEDHGPYLGPSRGLDLSPAAFREVVGPLGTGVGEVNYRVISVGQPAG